jgi:hypothetical protein
MVAHLCMYRVKQSTAPCACTGSTSDPPPRPPFCPSYCLLYHRITRNNLGVYKPQVIGLPILLFVTGVVSASHSSNSSSSSSSLCVAWVLSSRSEASSLLLVG